LLSSHGSWYVYIVLPQMSMLTLSLISGCKWPVSEGGLGVINPIMDLLTVHDEVDKEPSKAFAEQIQKDFVAYKSAEGVWLGDAGEGTDKTFMPFNKYILGRETMFSTWDNVWQRLQNMASARSLHQVVGDAKWYNCSFVDKWVTAVYEEIKSQFGDLKIVELTLIPVGMLSAFRSAKIAWDS
jgi:hypothetical protein